MALSKKLAEDAGIWMAWRVIRLRRGNGSLSHVGRWLKSLAACRARGKELDKSVLVSTYVCKAGRFVRRRLIEVVSGVMLGCGG